jgi:hypothetical protein
VNITTYNVLSLGGVTVGLSILGWVITQWWMSNKKKNLKAFLKLVPFLLCASYGMVLVLSAGGLLGAGADWTMWGTSEIGNAALQYGVGGGTPAVTRGSNLVLSDGGHAVVIIATVCLLAAWALRRGFRWDFLLAVVCGISLGLSSGIAGAAGYVLSPVVSGAGDAVVGLL